ncbi:MAG: PEP-CTERM sorting domain-containing protein [Telluria sp.]
MKKPITSLLLAAACWCGMGAYAVAAPLATIGASYSVYIYGTDSAAPALVTGEFDGMATSSGRAGLTLALSESETVLGGGRSRIQIDLRANGDLFPVSGESAYLGVGVYGDPLQFIVPVVLESVLVRFYTDAGLLYQSPQLLSLVQHRAPWDGIIPAPASAIVVNNAGGHGINRVSYELDVADAKGQTVPEPGTLLLGALALAALAGTQRARRRQD